MTFLYQIKDYPTGVFQIITPESDSTGEIIHIKEGGFVHFLGGTREACSFVEYANNLSMFSEFHRIETE